MTAPWSKNTLGQRPTEAEFARMPKYVRVYIERLERERDALRAQLAEPGNCDFTTEVP